MLRILILSGLLVGCDCGDSPGSDGGVDAGDAGGDAGFDVFVPIDAALPDTGPPLATCDGFDDPDRACVEAGWFHLVQWSPLFYRADESAPSGNTDHIVRRVYLDAFAIDRTEVTNAAYAAFVADSGHRAPSCDGAVSFLEDESFREVTMRVPWEGADVMAGYEQAPVFCVSRADARAYCASVGGRLPTPFEWFKAGAEPYPEAAPRFPWGDESPEGSIRGSSDPMPMEGAIAGATDVDSTPASESLHGVLGLSGLASELLAGCPEELVPATTESWVRPDVETGDCPGDRAIVAGSNWLGTDQGLVAYTPMLFALEADGRAQFMGERFHAVSQVAVINGGRDITEGRTWQIGFRCAHDL